MVLKSVQILYYWNTNEMEPFQYGVVDFVAFKYVDFIFITCNYVVIWTIRLYIYIVGRFHIGR